VVRAQKFPRRKKKEGEKIYKKTGLPFASLKQLAALPYYAFVDQTLHPSSQASPPAHAFVRGGNTNPTKKTKNKST
jgi:hypothetical protein